ncbi:HlyD family secretion protein [Ascidiimonas aurantiaca]|uniref:HlyD family secretion protein n=1 Tax=Ascidiimonas aurantiaca TaxID=1685432 RepID=UPI0030EE18C2
MKSLFPEENIENTYITYTLKHKIKNKIIYMLISIGIIGFLLALPFIKVKVYTSSRGIIKSDTEYLEIKTINSGRVLNTKITPNMKVKKGDTLIILESYSLDKRITLISNQIEVLKENSRDLKYLLESRNYDISKLLSKKYRREVMYYEEKLDEFKTQLIKAKVDLKRNKALLQKGVIANADFETVKLKYDLALNDLKQFTKQQLNTWQVTFLEVNTQLKEIVNEKDQLLQNKSHHVLTAPANGVLVNILGVEQGSFLYSGNTIATISPESKLIVECYVSPIDIGMINIKSPINFQIDAFNYNQWGVATGRITSIGGDVEIINNEPMFKVRCNLNNPYLALKNGAKGPLKKGMTLNAHFVLTERTLYQLLYDKADNWLNPTLKKR